MARKNAKMQIEGRIVVKMLDKFNGFEITDVNLELLTVLIANCETLKNKLEGMMNDVKIARIQILEEELKLLKGEIKL